jgi:hypothetical protein
MKTLIFKALTALVLLFPMTIFAQSPADDLFEKYSGKDGITSVTISQSMFDLFASLETEADEAGLAELVKKLTGIKILTVDAGSPQKINFHQEILKSAGAKSYEEVMVVKKQDQDIIFMIKKSGDVISELLMFTQGEADNAMISIQGDIDLKTISKLSRSMNIGGFENLEELK